MHATEHPLQTPSQGRRRWGVVILLFLGILISYIDRANLSIAAVPMMRELKFSPAVIGTLMSAFFWTYGGLQIPAGYLIDRFGFRWVYAGAFLIWSAASAGIGVAHSFSEIMLLRLLLGAGEAIAAPASLAYIKRNFTENEQGLPTGIYISGMMLGPSVGAFLGGVLTDRIGWRLLFVTTGLFALIWVVPWTLVSPVRLVPHRTQTAHRGAFPWRRLLTSPVTWGVTTAAFLYSYFWFFCLTWLPSYLVMSRNLSLAKMGRYIALSLLAMAISAIFCGRLADRAIKLGRRPLAVRKGFTMAGMALGSVIVAALAMRTPLQVLGVLMFCLTGVGLAGANYWALTQLVSPPSLIGRVIGYQNTIAQMGGACAPILTGWLVGQSNNFGAAITLAGLAPLIAAVIILSTMGEASVARLQLAVAVSSDVQADKMAI